MADKNGRTVTRFTQSLATALFLPVGLLKMKQIVILISGRGSNMEALIRARDQGQLPANIAAVISNRPDAAGWQRPPRRDRYQRSGSS